MGGHPSSRLRSSVMKAQWSMCLSEKAFYFAPNKVEALWLEVFALSDSAH